MSTAEYLDRAAAAREVSTLVALVLMKTSGDAGQALLLIESIDDCHPEDEGELNCLTIGAQAIRDALALRGDA